MKQRAARHRDRGMMVNRAGAWGAVLYVRKRAYWWGRHYPVDALGITRTAQATSWAAINVRLGERLTASC